MNAKKLFHRFSYLTTQGAGSPYAFGAAITGILIWLSIGFFVGFSNNTYQLAINTITTIITFLMVFLIQASQNRDSESLHLKLDELIASSEKARNIFLKTDELEDAEIARLKREFQEKNCE